MKTGTAIALLIGVPVTVGIIAWAVVASKVVDEIGKGRGGAFGNLDWGDDPPPFQVMTRNGEKSLLVASARGTLSWAEKAAEQLGFNASTSATTVIEALVSKIPGVTPATPLSLVVFDEFSGRADNTDEFPDFVSNSQGRTWGEVVAIASAWLTEQGV
jgi:hypothetical protein